MATNPKENDFGKKILTVLFGVLLVYLTFYLVTLMRNNLKTFETIGRADKMERTVTVSGTGKVSANNDIAITTIGYTNVDRDIVKARAENNKVMDAVMSEIKKLGIEDKDLQSNYTIYPENDYTQTGSVFKGYRVTNNVTVKIRDLSKITTVLSLAGRFGVNQVSGLQFTIDDPENLKGQARGKALLDAKRKALLLASQLNVMLDEMISYNEFDSQPNYGIKEAYGMGGSATDSSSGPSMVSSGSQDISVNVSLTYTISQSK